MIGERTMQWCIPLDRVLEAKREFEAAVAASRLLTSRERTVLGAVASGCTLEDAGKDLGISRERARQLAHRARSKLLGHADKNLSSFERGEAVARALSERQRQAREFYEEQEARKQRQLALERASQALRAKEMAQVAIVTRARTLFYQLEFLRREHLRLNGGQRTYR